jgi:DNA-binding NarL/FixJ family response regulator
LHKVRRNQDPGFASFSHSLNLYMSKPFSSPGAGTAKADQESNRIRVLLSDQHALVRAGIRALLERIDEVKVVAEGAGGQQTLELIEAFNPNILLLDTTMPGFSGLELLKEIVDKFPRVRVIVLTLHDNEEYAALALRAGAAGILSESAASNELELAIKAVARGEDYLATEISKQATLKYLKGAVSGTFSPVLTARQREVLQMIAEGHATKEIARLLNISAKTVETHRAQTMDRLDIHDVVGLVRYAIKIGLVEIDQ